MDFTRREIALIVMAVGVIMVCTAAWMERRRKYRMMPYLVPPMPLLILGGAIALISFAIALLPKPF